MRQIYFTIVSLLDYEFNQEVVVISINVASTINRIGGV